MIKLDLITRMQCSKCQKNAIIFQKYSGLRLCESHFKKDFESKAKRTIRQHRWVGPGDRLAIGLNGGTSGPALISFLHSLFQKRRDVSLVAVTIDEGAGKSRDTRPAADLAAEFGIEWHSRSFVDEIGISMDDIVRKRGHEEACTICRIIRRYCLTRFAHRVGATRVACGITLDDEARLIMTDVIRGRPFSLLHPPASNPGIVPFIRPFMHIPRDEVALYASLKGLPAPARECPLSSASDIYADVGAALDAYTDHHPEAPHAILRTCEALSQIGRDPRSRLAACPRCGEIGTGQCPACTFLSEVADGTE